MKRGPFEKNNGLFYSPPELAKLLARQAIMNANDVILDPSYGEGSLLIAAYYRLKELGSRNPANQLFGYDINPPTETNQIEMLSKVTKPENINTQDFFQRITNDDGMKNEVNLMNPPFVRHHDILKVTENRIRPLFEDSYNIDGTSNLWVYFLIHSLSFLLKGGTIGAILPWSFLFTDFSRHVRELLAEQFRKIQVIILGKRMFDMTNERIIILLCKDYQRHLQDIEITYTYEIPIHDSNWTPINKNKWNTAQLNSILTKDTENTVRQVGNRIGYKPLGLFADIHIGTVTGANNFFIIDKNQAEKNGIPERYLKPILKRSNQLNQLALEDSGKISDYIILIPKDIVHGGKIRDYIRDGEENGINKGYHTSRRNPWYSIPNPEPPDGFLHYMTNEIPFITLNLDKLLSTNTIHQVFFKSEVDENVRKWIQISMLSSISQLSCEQVCRSYGAGVLKIEPSSSKKILVYPGDGKPFPSDLVESIDTHLLSDNKRKAMEVVDKWCLSNFTIRKKDWRLIHNSYIKLRAIRLGERIDIG